MFLNTIKLNNGRVFTYTSDMRPSQIIKDPNEILELQDKDTKHFITCSMSNVLYIESEEVRN